MDRKASRQQENRHRLAMSTESSRTKTYGGSNMETVFQSFTTREKVSLSVNKQGTIATKYQFCKEYKLLHPKSSSIVLTFSFLTFNSLSEISDFPKHVDQADGNKKTKNIDSEMLPKLMFWMFHPLVTMISFKFHTLQDAELAEVGHEGRVFERAWFLPCSVSWSAVIWMVWHTEGASTVTPVP